MEEAVKTSFAESEMEEDNKCGSTVADTECGLTEDEASMEEGIILKEVSFDELSDMVDEDPGFQDDMSLQRSSENASSKPLSSFPSFPPRYIVVHSTLEESSESKSSFTNIAFAQLCFHQEEQRCVMAAVSFSEPKIVKQKRSKKSSKRQTEKTSSNGFASLVADSSGDSTGSLSTLTDTDQLYSDKRNGLQSSKCDSLPYIIGMAPTNGGNGVVENDLYLLHDIGNEDVELPTWSKRQQGCTRAIKKMMAPLRMSSGRRQVVSASKNPRNNSRRLSGFKNSYSYELMKI